MIPENNKGRIFLIPSFLSEDNEKELLAPQVIDVVKGVDFYLVEEVRTARRFISKLRTGRVIEDLKFFQVNKDTSASEVKEILNEIPEGSDIGVISEAGCPGIADPGAVVVRVAHFSDRKVVPLPGPSSIFMALMASGFSGQQFRFVGYLPIDRNSRVKEIKSLEKECQKGESQIFMETPYRNNQMLEDLLKELAPGTELCIAADITAKTEFIKSQTVLRWKGQIPDLYKRPTVFIISSQTKK